MNQHPRRHRHSLGCAARFVAAKPVDALSFTINHAKHDIHGRPCARSAAFPCRANAECIEGVQGNLYFSIQFVVP